MSYTLKHVGTAGIEPAYLRLSRPALLQLSYVPMRGVWKSPSNEAPDSGWK